MKHTLLLPFFFAIIACSSNTQQTQNQEIAQPIVDSSIQSQQTTKTAQLTEQKRDSASNTTEEEKLVIDFYKYYVSKSLGNESDYLKDSTLKKYISQRKLNEIKKQYASEDGIDADPFLQVQDVFAEWKNISITATKKLDETHAEIRIKLGSDLNARNLKITVLKQNGILKIDQIDNE